jgi:integrase
MSGTKGSVYRRNGTWTVHLSWQRGGRQQQVKKGGFATKGEANDALVDLAKQIQDGRYVPIGRRTVAEYLTGWLDTLPVSGRRPTTITAYRWLVTKWIIPELGDIPLRDLTAVDIDRLYGVMAANVSLRTVRHCHSVLRRALQDAADKGALPSNPAASASPPKTSATRAPEKPVWSPEELSTFLDQTRDHHLGALIRVATMTGLRRGELCGLRWSDVDLDAGTLKVQQTIVTVAGVPVVDDVKSAYSRRTVDLDAGTVATLRRHQTEQKKVRLMAGPGWRDRGLVFTNPTGDPWHPDTVTGTVQRLIDKSDLPRTTLHGFRHGHITHLLIAGVDVKTVSARAGHASAAFTLDRYGHVLAGRQAAAAAAVAALVDKGQP